MLCSVSLFNTNNFLSELEIDAKKPNVPEKRTKCLQADDNNLLRTWYRFPLLVC